MPGAGFSVTKMARRATRIGGRVNHTEKACANRRNRRHLRQELHVHREDAVLTPKLWTDWDVI
jgi:hypothetical protein